MEFELNKDTLLNVAVVIIIIAVVILSGIAINQSFEETRETRAIERSLESFCLENGYSNWIRNGENYYCTGSPAVNAVRLGWMVPLPD